jgi:hypothetical protein
MPSVDDEAAAKVERRRRVSSLPHSGHETASAEALTD